MEKTVLTVLGLIVLLPLTLLLLLVNAETTFFDQDDDAFIMGDSTTGGSASGGTTGGGGGCLTNWTCSNWNSCTNGVQVRNCTKTKTSCDADLKMKPVENQTCEVSILGTELLNATKNKTGSNESVILDIVTQNTNTTQLKIFSNASYQDNSAKNIHSAYYALSILILMLLVFLIFFFRKKKKEKIKEKKIRKRSYSF